jgi:hypothetical protein
MKMFWKWFWKALAFLLVLAIFVGGGIAIYQAGFAQGANAAIWNAESGAEVTTPMVLPQPGSFTRMYGRPLVLLPFFSLFLGFLFLMVLFGGFRRYSHFKMWKSAGMPGAKGMQPHWHKHHRGPYWDPGEGGDSKPGSTENPASQEPEPDSAEDA